MATLNDIPPYDSKTLTLTATTMRGNMADIVETLGGNSLPEYLQSLDPVSITLIILPIVATVICLIYLLVKGRKNNSIQQRKAAQASRSKHQYATNNQQYQQHLQQQLKSRSGHSPGSPGSAAKYSRCKSNVNSNVNSSVNSGAHNRAAANAANSSKSVTSSMLSAAAIPFTPICRWFGYGDAIEMNEDSQKSSYDEDKTMKPPRQKNQHRDSTSSDGTNASEDLNSSITSSNEDITDTYCVVPKGSSSSKKPNGSGSSKSRQRRQQRQRQRQHNHNNNISDMLAATEAVACFRGMDADISPSLQAQQAENLQPTAASCKLKQTPAAVAAASTGSASEPAESFEALMERFEAQQRPQCNMRTSPMQFNTAPTAAYSSSNSSNSSSGDSANSSPTASPGTRKRCTDDYHSIIAQALKLSHNLTESQFAQLLQRYLLDGNLQRVYGFPVSSCMHAGCTEIYKVVPRAFQPPKLPGVINTNDGLLRPNATDSGKGSSSSSSDSSPAAVDSDSSEAAEDETAAATPCVTPDGMYQIFSQYDKSLEKQCVRCHKAFQVTDAGVYINPTECYYHSGKLHHLYTSGKGFGHRYSCCDEEAHSQGCLHNSHHVWSGVVVGLNGPYADFVHTQRKRQHYQQREQHNNRVYALDCEMCYTGLGLELTKITVVDYRGNVAYEHFVRPRAEIVDYNTRFSGITAEDLNPQRTDLKTLSEVQQDLLRMFDEHTILIGHGLDNDLRVLRLQHKAIVDTSVVFPHNNGFPYRRSLKSLAKTYLNRDIQNSELGHDSLEDARACLDLIHQRVCENQPMSC